MKPDPAIYRRLCDRFSLEASQCLFIDDLPRNIEGARSAGLNGYCFQDGDVAKLRSYLECLDA